MAQLGEPLQAPDTRGPARPGRLRAVAPWLVAAALLAWIFHQVPVADAWQAARGARLGTFAATVAAAVVFWFLLESRLFAYLFSRFHAPVSWREARSLRGLTYLLTPVNWNLGTAGVVLHLRRTRGIAALDATASMLFYGAVDGIVMPGLLALGVLALPPQAGLQRMGWIGAAVALGQLAMLALLMADAPRWRWLERLRAVRVLSGYRRAAWRDVALLGAGRALYFSGFVLVFWWGTRAFAVDLPLALAAASMPVVLAAGALPVTPAGLGTQQAAMLWLYRPYGGEAAIVAFGLAYPAALLLGRIALGLLYLGDLRAFRSAQAAPDDEPAAEASPVPAPPVEAARREPA